MRVRVTQSADVTRRKGHGHQVQSKNDVAPKTTKRRQSWKKHLKDPECKIGIKDPGTRRQLLLEIERTSDGFDRNTFRPEFVKRASRMSSGLREERDWPVWRSRSPAKRENRN
jgi:hypothetical protein